MSKLNQEVGYQLTSHELHHRQKSVSGHPGPLVVAAGVTDPLNIGSIFRICDAVGSREVWFVDSPPLSGQKVRHVSRSVSDKLPHAFLTISNFLTRVVSLPPLVALEITSNSTDLYLTELPKDSVFVVGSERYGIPDEVLDVCSQAIHIPMFGINSSMNVATSLGIALYEWHRRFRYAART